MAKHLWLIFALLLGLFGPDLTLAAGPIVKVSQVDMSNYPEVTVYASVTNERGQPVTGLTAADFVVTEDSVPVILTDFAGPGDTRSVDIVFVFDTTTSMGEEVDGMKETSLAFAEKLERSGADYYLALVDFGDVINRVEHPDGQLTADAQQFKAWINEIRLAGGGYDIPELTLGALQQATWMSFRADTLKICILITDAPPHHYGDPPDAEVYFDDSSLTLEYTLQRLQEANVTAYIVAPEHPDYMEIVNSTNGEFFNIHSQADFTTIIDEIGGLIATQYRLVYTSPRPTYDGTRRNIELTVGGVTGRGAYLERHLLNIHSDPVVGMICLLPLLVLLVAPTGLHLVSRLKSLSAPVPTSSLHPHACSHCGQLLKSTARFCPHCGQVVVPDTSAPPSMVCPYCQNVLRTGAKFCGACGRKL